jgi:hypothetical protein
VPARPRGDPMTEDMRARAAFARAFDAALSERGVTLAHLHRRLAQLGSPVSVATLSYWRSGHRHPERSTSLAAVDVLEELLGLPVGGLAAHLAPVRRPGPPGRQVPIEELTGHEAAVRTALAHLDFDSAHDELAEDAIALSLDVDAQGRARRMSALVRWRALQEGARRAAVVMTLDHPDEAPPRLVPRAGVEAGRSWSDPDHQVHVSELLLERPLAHGDAGFGEYEVVVDGRPRTSRSLAYYAPRRVSQVLVWARFEREALPRRFEAFDVVDGEETVEPMDIGTGRTVHRRTGQYGPGTLGIRWEW